MTSDTSPDVEALHARLQELQAENERLREGGDAVSDAGRPRTASRGRWRAFLSAVCIVVATILVPVSIVAAWARAELVDETSFVTTFAPLAGDPHVQRLVTTQVTTAIDDSLDLEGITNDLFDGLEGLDLPPRALAAIDLLRVPAVQGLHGLIDSTVTQLVESEAFAEVWQVALRTSHRSLAAVAAGGTSNGAVSISAQGELGIQLGPIIDEIRQRLLDRGVGLAASIPVIDQTIVIAQSDALALVGTVYNLAVTVGWWVPVAALVLFLGGILAARRRSTAVLGAGVGLALGSAVLAVGLSIGGSVLALNGPALGITPAALTAVYDQVTGAMRDTALVTVLVGLVVAVIAWTTGRWRAATATRRSVASINAGLRAAARERGVDTGSAGLWLYRQRLLVRIVLGVVAVIWLLLLRPLSTSDVFLVLIVWLFAWWLTELAQVRPGEAPAASKGSATEAAPKTETDASTLDDVAEAEASVTRP